MSYYKLKLESKCTFDDTFTTDYLGKSVILDMLDISKKDMESSSREIRSNGWALPSKREFNIKRINDNEFIINETIFLDYDYNDRTGRKADSLFDYLKQLVNSEFRNRKILNYID